MTWLELCDLIEELTQIIDGNFVGDRDSRPDLGRASVADLHASAGEIVLTADDSTFFVGHRRTSLDRRPIAAWTQARTELWTARPHLLGFRTAF